MKPTTTLLIYIMFTGVVTAIVLMNFAHEMTHLMQSKSLNVTVKDLCVVGYSNQGNISSSGGAWVFPGSDGMDEDAARIVGFIMAGLFTLCIIRMIYISDKTAVEAQLWER